MPQFFIDFHMFSMICIDLLTSSLIFVLEDWRRIGRVEEEGRGLKEDWNMIGGGLEED